MENVFSPEFYDCQRLKELELHYVAQSFYGDEIRMYQKSTGDTYQIAGVKTDGTIVMSGTMTF